MYLVGLALRGIKFRVDVDKDSEKSFIHLLYYINHPSFIPFIFRLESQFNSEIYHILSRRVLDK